MFRVFRVWTGWGRRSGALALVIQLRLVFFCGMQEIGCIRFRQVLTCCEGLSREPRFWGSGFVFEGLSFQALRGSDVLTSRTYP